MPDLTTARKLVVAREISRLTGDVGEAVRSVYGLYDRLEFLNYISLYLFLMAGIVFVPVLGYGFEVPVELGAIGRPLALLLAAFIWTGGFLVARRFYIVPRRLTLKKEIAATLDRTGKRTEIERALRRIDPSLVRNCGPIE